VLRADMVAMIVLVRLIGDSGLGCGESFRSVDNVMLRVGQLKEWQTVESEGGILICGR